MTRRLALFTFLGLLLAAAPAAQADPIVFSNFGPSFSYNTGAGNFIGNGLDSSGNNYAEADTFTPSATYTLLTVEIALSNFFSTNTDELQVNIMSDSLGSPGAILASEDVLPGTLGTFGNTNPPVSLDFSAFDITLGAGTPYWVSVLDVSGGGDSNVWNWNSTGDSSSQAISTDGGMTWFTPSGLPPGAYEVDGTTPGAPSVPEPGTLTLLASGVVGLLGSQLRRLRRRTRRPATRRPQLECLEDRVVPSTTFSWTQANSAAFGAGTMLQYPNGTIMMVGDLVYNNGGFSFQGGQSNLWQVMVPSGTGSYVNYSEPFAYLTNYSRLYYATNVLPNGNIFLLGGEDSSAGSETNTGEMFTGPDNGVGGTGWNNITNFPQPTFGDDPSMLLNNGLILLGTGSEQGYPYTNTALTYLYNPTSSAITTMVNGSSQSIAPGTYSAGIPKAWNETNVEEGWVKLPSGNVVSYDLWVSNFFGPSSGGYGEMFNAGTGTWQDISPGDRSANGFIPALSAPTDPFGQQWDEMGPAVLLPNGNVFFIGGGTSNTALYNPSTNTWSSGPQIPFPYTSDDAPAAVMPNGDVIFTADAALVNGEYTGPTAFFDYTPPANGVGPGSISQLTGSNAPGDPGLARGSYTDRMLVLPTGQLMFSDAQGGETWVGTPSGAPLPQWRPVVSSITGGSGVYTLTGQRLNGMDAGAAYGDDAGMDENYPIVRLTNGVGTVYYATTSNWSNYGVATGSATETVTFTLPSGIPSGNYSLVVSGAGFNSFPVAFHVPAGGSAAIVHQSAGSGKLGGIVHVGLNSAGLETPLNLQTIGSDGQTTGLRQFPPPAPLNTTSQRPPAVYSSSTLMTKSTMKEVVDAVFADEKLFEILFGAIP